MWETLLLSSLSLGLACWAMRGLRATPGAALATQMLPWAPSRLRQAALVSHSSMLGLQLGFK